MLADTAITSLSSLSIALTIIHKYTSVVGCLSKQHKDMCFFKHFQMFFFCYPIFFLKYCISNSDKKRLENLVCFGTNKSDTSLYASFLFITILASSLSIDTQTPGMSNSHIVSVSVNVRSTIFSRSSSFKSSFTSSRLCLISVMRNETGMYFYKIYIPKTRICVPTRI